MRGELSPETKPALMLLDAERTPALADGSLAELAARFERALQHRELAIYEANSQLETHGVLYWQPLRVWVSQPLSNAELDQLVTAAVDWANDLREAERTRSGRTRPVAIAILDWSGRPQRRRLVKRGGTAARTLRTPRRRPRRPEPGRRLR